MAHEQGALQGLEDLDRRNWSSWLLNGLLLVVMSAVITSLYLPQVWGEIVPDLPAPETRGVLLVGMCGLVLIFMLYMLLKQREAIRLRNDLICGRMREEILRSRLSEITSLFDMSTSVNMQLSTEAILDLVTLRVLTCLEADQSSILLWNPETQLLECRSVQGIDVEFVKDARCRMGEGIAGQVVQRGESLVLNEDDIRRRFPTSKKTGRNITSALCIPLMANGQAIGVLNINRIGRDHPFTVTDALILTMFGEHTALAIQRVGEFQALDSRASLLEEANRHLVEVSRMKEIIVYTVSHELKTPLTCIIAYAEFLRQDENAIGPEQRKTLTRDLHDQAIRLLDLVNDIMDLSQLEGGAAKLHLAPADLNAIVESSVQTLGTIAVRKGIRLSRELSADVPEIAADASKLRQVTVNLLNNALKFTEGGGTIDVATRYTDGQIVVEVRDSGIGIEADDLSRVFDLFARSDVAIHRNYEGLGLGLHLVKGLVELHGGHVWVESAPGKGSCFSFSLPVAGPLSLEAQAPTIASVDSPPAEGLYEDATQTALAGR